MRKWIAGLLALTALSPMSASAQDLRDEPGSGSGLEDRARVATHVEQDGRPATRERLDGGERRRDGGVAAGRGVRPDAPRGGPDARDGRRDPGFDRADRPDRGGRPRRDGWQQRPDRPAAGERRPDGERVRPGRRPGDTWPRPGDDRQDLGRAPIGRPGDDYWRRPAPGRTDRDWRRDRRPDRDAGQQFRDDRRDDWTRSRFDDREDGWRWGSGFGNRDGWNRDWRGDRRYDWSRYRAANRDAFRLPRYYAPGGWSGGYRRFVIGAGLEAPLWGRGYWIDDPYAYHLPDAYGPYRWVRYYDDALLVDVRTGTVVDAAYGIFW